MRIETCYRRPGLDGRGTTPAEKLALALGESASVRVADVVLLDFPLPKATAEELFSDPVTQFVAEVPLPGLSSFSGWDWLVEIAYRPGVTDTLALTAREAVVIADGAPIGGPWLVQTARLYIVKARQSSADIVRRAFSSLWNPLVQSAIILSNAEWESGARLPDLYPTVSLADDPESELFELGALDDEGLEALSSSRLLALSLAEMRAVKAYFESTATRADRAAAGLPSAATDVEIEMIAQTW